MIGVCEEHPPPRLWQFLASKWQCRRQAIRLKESGIADTVPRFLSPVSSPFPPFHPVSQEEPDEDDQDPAVLGKPSATTLAVLGIEMAVPTTDNSSQGIGNCGYCPAFLVAFLFLAFLYRRSIRSSVLRKLP